MTLTSTDPVAAAHALSPEETLAALEVSDAGLSTTEATARRQRRKRVQAQSVSR